MSLLNLLLIAFFASLAPNKEPSSLFECKKGLVRTLFDLARLAEGRVLTCFIKEGMRPEDVNRILGSQGPVCIASGIGHYCWSYITYGIHVDFTPPFGIDVEKYDPRVIGVHFYVPPEYKWSLLRIFGKSPEQKKQSFDLRHLLRYFSTDPNKRMHELLNNSEDVRKDEEEWERMWFMDGSSGAGRVHGGIQ